MPTVLRDFHGQQTSKEKVLFSSPGSRMKTITNRPPDVYVNTRSRRPRCFALICLPSALGQTRYKVPYSVFSEKNEWEHPQTGSLLLKLNWKWLQVFIWKCTVCFKSKRFSGFYHIFHLSIVWFLFPLTSVRKSRSSLKIVSVLTFWCFCPQYKEEKNKQTHTHTHLHTHAHKHTQIHTNTDRPKTINFLIFWHKISSEVVHQDVEIVLVVKPFYTMFLYSYAS